MFIDKQIMATIPPGVAKKVAQVEMCYSKLLNANNEVETYDFETGAYYDEPEVHRGQSRQERHVELTADEK